MRRADALVPIFRVFRLLALCLVTFSQKLPFRGGHHHSHRAKPQAIRNPFELQGYLKGGPDRQFPHFLLDRAACNILQFTLPLNNIAGIWNS